MIKPPTSVKLISLLYLIEGILALILGGIFIFGAGLIAVIPMLTIVSAVLLPFAFFLFVIGILNIIVYKSLRKGKNWARIYAIIVSILGVISAFTGAGIILGILHGAILYFLLFDKKTKRFFK